MVSLSAESARLKSDGSEGHIYFTITSIWSVCINHMYNGISTAASSECIDVDNVESCKDYIVPGWNNYVKDTYCDARQSYILWHDMSKPRHGPICDMMNRSRLNFKYALRQCQSNNEAARADVMA